MKPSDGGRCLRQLAFAQATGAPGGVVGWCAARLRALGRREVAQAAFLAR
jgi:hypothetical protein